VFPAVLVLFILAFSEVSQAHPMDSYAIDQYLDFRLRPGEIQLVHRVEFAEIPTAAELPAIDKNTDLVLTDEETAPYVEKNVPNLVQELQLEIAGESVPLNYRAGECFMDTIPAPRLRLVTQYTVPLPEVTPDGVPVHFSLNHRPDARGDRQTRLVCEGAFSLHLVESSETVQPPGMAAPSINEATALVYGHQVSWLLLPAGVEHKPAVPEFAKRDEPPAPEPQNPFSNLNERGIDDDLLYTGQMNEGEIGAEPKESGLRESAQPQFGEEGEEGAESEPWADRQFRLLLATGEKIDPFYFFLASVLALIYGAAHALEPGHGKTVVGAYLIGSHGTVFHAVMLALIVTFTHTFSVYILGVIALTNLEKVQGTYLPVLEVGSWALIFFMGLFLFLKYYRYYASGTLADPTFHTHGIGGAHSHGPGGHSHDHGHGHDHGHHHPHDHGHSHDHGHDHEKTHSHSHTQLEGDAHAMYEAQPSEHTHSQAHGHSHDHEHPHDPDHGHDHRHDPPSKKVKGAGSVSFWNLLILGMTGGIVPCPGALFVMMMALASGAAAFGLYLITVFSVGLALTLMTVGIVMVKGRGMVDRFAPNSNLIQVLPVVSSLIIMFVGAGFMLNGLMKHGILTINL
jgi:ABC-type nickel/cobalt efflux system permease component RcnA